jgi:hypothetical protein
LQGCRHPNKPSPIHFCKIFPPFHQLLKGGAIWLKKG